MGKISFREIKIYLDENPGIPVPGNEFRQSTADFDYSDAGQASKRKTAQGRIKKLYH